MLHIYYHSDQYIFGKQIGHILIVVKFLPFLGLGTINLTVIFKLSKTTTFLQLLFSKY